MFLVVFLFFDSVPFKGCLSIPALETLAGTQNGEKRKCLLFTIFLAFQVGGTLVTWLKYMRLGR